ncbi:MarR family winged helix-turn-helix transcriptional regulator [Brevibacillus dissolubilis]|uniref:MarR family winged helix-turn-helix transcriptional regulator n=1 Tax=Brevibacillus dissolubilis TaxID=1844116 RepID=UPI001117750A|nr:MarR family transcriptional regulator [Brevibacillus dissolubilis]
MQDDSLGFRLNYAARRISQLLALRMAPYDITTEQWSTLNRLAEQDGISQKDLARRVGKDQTNVTRILDQLERKGLAERRPNAEDRRSFLAFVTDAGLALNETVSPIEEEVIKSLVYGVSDEQLHIFSQVLRQITETAETEIKEMER